MADNTSISPGSGEVIRDIDRAGVKTQVVQIDVGGESGEVLLVGDNTAGIPTAVKSVAGNVTVVQPTAGNLKVDASGVAVPITDNSGSLTVDAPVATPVAVRLSSGSAFVDTIPVSGTMTANQGTPGSAASPWPMEVTDGTTVAGVDSSSHGLKVAIVSGGGGGTAQADKSTFTEGTTTATPIAGEYNAAPSSPSSGQAAAVQITQKRGLHINLRDSSGAELGTSSNPVRTDPTGGTTQPVSGTVTAEIKDQSGTAYSATNPLYTSRGGRAQTRVTNSVALSASQTAQAIWTPAAGKKFYIQNIVLVVTTAGPLKIFDGSDAAGNRVFDSGSANWPTGVFSFDFDEPFPSATINDVLEYTSGAGLVAVITVHGFEV